MTSHWDIEIALIHLGQECDSTVKTVEQAFLAIGKMTEDYNRIIKEARAMTKDDHRWHPFDAQKEVADRVVDICSGTIKD